MARIELAPEVADDVERILAHLAEYEVEHPDRRIAAILDAISVLETNPLIGRPAGGERRELIMGHGAHGYVALYRYAVVPDVVLVLAIRSQREAGYSERG